MADSDNKQSFWTTIPGILTGFAAVLTASTGFYLAVHHGSPEASEQPKSAPIVTPDTRPAPPAVTSGSTASAVPTSAAADGTGQGSVTVRSRAGDDQLALKSFHHNMTDDGIQLASGQTIAFEKIHALDFLSVDGDAHLVALKITLADGRALDANLATNYAFKGESDLGPFVIFVQDVKQIVFNR